MRELDEGLRARMGRCSQKLVARFVPEKFADGRCRGISAAAAKTGDGYGKGLAEA